MSDDGNSEARGSPNPNRIPVPQGLYDYVRKWHRWYNIIVHRGANFAPLVTDPFPDFYRADEIRPAPFPLSIGGTWICGALIALVLLVHDGVDEGRVFKKAYYSFLHWAGRVIGRVLLTVGAAFLSTLSFEIIGGVLSKMFTAATLRLEDRISVELIKRYHWGELDEDGEPVRRMDGTFIWAQDPSQRREAIRETIQGLAVLVFDYIVTLLLQLGNELTQLFTERTLGPALNFFFAIPLNFIPGLLMWLVLPIPELDDAWDFRKLWLECGIPAVIQFWVVVFLWLLIILYMAKAERIALDRGSWKVVDPKMMLSWHLLRATAMHLIAYTAYQLVCGIIGVLRSKLFQESRYITLVDGPIVPFLGRIIPNGRIFAAALLFFFHWILRVASILAVRLALPLWKPYILWQTRFSSAGTDLRLPIFLETLAQDVSVLDPRKRVTSRVAMTAMFGLRSSWPARFHLSRAVNDG